VAEIVRDLRALGLRSGVSVLVHSSLSSIGRVEGGAQTVVTALEQAVAPGGTVLAPTFTGGPQLSAACPPVFDPVRDAGWTGAVAEALRTRPDAVRSLHPTHSVAAIGARAVELTRGHVNSVSPCDVHSPFARVDFILLLGVDHESNTTFHHVEELVGVDYHLQDELVRTPHGDLVLHRYGTPRRFMALDDALTAAGVQTVGRVGAAEARLVHARSFVSIAADALRASPGLFVKEEAWAGSRSRA
jgi:aminoglycoside 3-N-acetyltransferase